VTAGLGATDAIVGSRSIGAIELATQEASRAGAGRSVRHEMHHRLDAGRDDANGETGPSPCWRLALSGLPEGYRARRRAPEKRW
jgi:hypothetical protein